MSKSPDEELKERIIEAIRREGLLIEKDLKKLEANYLQKGITIDDWTLWVENRILEEERSNAGQD